MEPNKGTTVRAATKMRKLASTMRRKTQSRANLIFSCRGKQRGAHAPLSPAGGELGGSSFFWTNWSFIHFSSLIMRYSAVFQQGLVCFVASCNAMLLKLMGNVSSHTLSPRTSLD